MLKKTEIPTASQSATGDGNIQAVGNNNVINQTFQKFINIFRSDIETIEQRNRRILLNHVENFWIKGLLEKSLHGMALLELGIKESPDSISYPWAIKRESSNETLPDGTSMLEIFDQIGLGRSLLILGAPGSGKTTMLLELTRGLIQRAREDIAEPIPVVFNLSSWTEQITLADWVARELNLIYTIPKKTAPNWIKENKILLLLDGLDEVRQENRNKCVAAINQFRKENGLTSMAVCTRTREYTELKTRIAFEGAIEIQPLTLKQVDEYFSHLGKGAIGIRKALKKDAILQEMAETPLFLSIMTLAYHDMRSKDVPVSNSFDEQRRHLLNTYIEHMFGLPRFKNFPMKKDSVTHWLSWLAYKMIEYDAVPYLLENMQPQWLGLKYGRGYDLVLLMGYGLITGLFGGLVGGLVGAIFGGIVGGPIAICIGIMFGSLLGATLGVISSFLLVLIFFLLTWLFIKIIWVIAYLVIWLKLDNWSSIGALIGAVFGVIFGILVFWELGYFGLREFAFVIIVGICGTMIGTIFGWLSSRRGVGKIQISPGDLENLRINKIFPTFSDEKIEMVESLKWNWRKAGQDTIFITLIYSMMCYMIGGPLFGLIIGLSIGLVYGLINGMENQPITQTTYPGQKITFSINNFLSASMFLVWMGMAIVIVVANISVIDASSFSKGFTTIIILFLALLAGTGLGGNAIFTHYCLRIALSIQNLLPWHLISFLDHCTDLIFLRRIGGGYIFIHRLLMEHFAQMYKTSPAFQQEGQPAPPNPENSRTIPS